MIGFLTFVPHPSFICEEREEVQDIDLKLREPLTLELELCFISFICPPKPTSLLRITRPWACTSWSGLATSQLISGCLVCQACSVPWAPWVPWKSRRGHTAISLPQDHLSSSKRNPEKSWGLNTLLPHPHTHLSLFSPTIPCYPISHAALSVWKENRAFALTCWLSFDSCSQKFSLTNG